MRWPPPLPTAAARLAAVGVCLWMTTLACSDPSPPAVVIASIEVTSPIGDRVALARTAQLTARARNAAGQVIPVIVSFVWGTSAAPIATVSSDGLVLGIAAGDATITAEANGVIGSLAMRVVAADFTGVTTTLADAFLGSLVTTLTAAVRTRVQTALVLCTTGVTAGNFVTLEACLAGVRAEVTGASDPTDRALLASVALFADHIERLLNL